MQNIKLKFKNWKIEELTGYKPITTCYMDLSLAEPFGKAAIKDTIKRCLDTFKAMHETYKYVTELYMALNWKIWEHYQTKLELAKFYQTQYDELYEYIVKNFNEEEKDYFFRTTD